MTNKNYLTTEAYKDMASEITDVVEDLKLTMHTLEFIRTPREINENGNFELEYYKVHQYSEVLFSKLQGLIAQLDHIGGTLYSVDELEELEGFVKDEWLQEEQPFKTFKEFKRDTEREHVTAAELSFYRKQGYSEDEILKKPVKTEGDPQ